MPDEDNNFGGSLGLDLENDDITCKPRIVEDYSSLFATIRTVRTIRYSGFPDTPSSCTDTISPRSCTLNCTLVFVRGKQVWRMCEVRPRVALACMQGMT